MYYSPPSPDNLAHTSNRFDAPRQDSSECDSLKEEVVAIDQRMRHPYTNPEGNYYRGQLHEISDRQYSLNCDR